MRKTHKRLIRIGALISGALIISALLPTGTATAAAVRYEAETAKLSQAVVATNHTGFSGNGFVDYTNVAGSYVEWTVSAPAAGTATLTFGYANGGTADRPMSISVNGKVVNASLSFAGTGSWDTWARKSLTATLNAGTNTVRATATVSAGGPNVDYLDATTASTTLDFQAENATISQGTVASNHTGFLGTGFVDYTNVAGSYVEFSVTSASAHPVGLEFRYANGSGTNRPMTVTVNGSPVAIDAPFAPTANWDTWTTLTISAKLNAGTNTVRATATGSMGGPNLDQLHLADPTTGAPAAWELRAHLATCHQISNGLYKTDLDSASATVPVCGATGASFWQADLDVDCDGHVQPGSPCNPADPNFQPDTLCHDANNVALDPAAVPYVVLPTPSTIWDFRTAGLGCGSVVAVMVKDQVFYAVVGDAGPTPIIGAASYATAKALGVADPNAGGIDSGVTYLVFQAKAPNITDHNGVVSTGQAAARAFVSNN